MGHRYQILKGYVTAENEIEAIYKATHEAWDDIIDRFDTDIFTDGYEVDDILEIT